MHLQADTQTTVTVLCLAGLHVLDNKNLKKKLNKKRWKNKKKHFEKRKNVTKIKKDVKRFFYIYAINIVVAITTSPLLHALDMSNNLLMMTVSK